MIRILIELKDVMDKHLLSVEKASQYLQVSTRIVYRWLFKGDSPSVSSQHKIRLGIGKINKAFMKSSISDTLERAKELWPKVRHHLTQEERYDLLELQMSGKYKEYIAKLEGFVEKYEKEE